MSKKPKDVPSLEVIEKESEGVEPACRHHWIIAEANGPVSWGECRVCHDGKEFQNSIPDNIEGHNKRKNPLGPQKNGHNKSSI